MQEWSQLLCSHLFIVIYWTSICTVFHKTQTGLIATTSTSFPDSILWHPSMITSCCTALGTSSASFKGRLYTTTYIPWHELINFLYWQSNILDLPWCQVLHFLWRHSSYKKTDSNFAPLNQNQQLCLVIISGASCYPNAVMESKAFIESTALKYSI